MNLHRVLPYFRNPKRLTWWLLHWVAASVVLLVAELVGSIWIKLVTESGGSTWTFLTIAPLFSVCLGLFFVFKHLSGQEWKKMGGNTNSQVADFTQDLES